MTTRGRSKAVAAAEQAAGSGASFSPPVDGTWTRSMVARAAGLLAELMRTPEYEEPALRTLVRDFLRFVDVVESGKIQPDARLLAEEIVRSGYDWLDGRAHLAPVQTRLWTLEMVEQHIVAWNELSKDKTRKASLEAIDRLIAFEAVVQLGAVQPGEAKHLADAFITYARAWLERNPDARKTYHQLR